MKLKVSMNIMTIKAVLTAVLFTISSGLNGQCKDERFLVRLDDQMPYVFSVDGFENTNKLIDTIRLPNSNSNVLYNGFGHLFLITRDEKWHFHLDSIPDHRTNACSLPSLGNQNFSRFLGNLVSSDDRSLISDLERGKTELKCNASNCVLYHHGLHLYKNSDAIGEIVYPRDSLVGGKFTFDFFQEKFLIFIAHYNKPNPDYGSQVYLFDLEKRELLWKYKARKMFQILDVKVAGDNIYLVFRKTVSDGYGFPPAPSLCIAATIHSLDPSSNITFKQLKGFNPAIIDIL